MTHLTALRNSVLCGFAVVAVAGCGAARSSNAAPHDGTTGTTAPVSAAAAVPTAMPDTSGVSQQISSVDNQLSSVGSQINAANAGLSTSEGDPSQ